MHRRNDNRAISSIAAVVAAATITALPVFSKELPSVLPNFHQLSPKLMRGGQPSDIGLQELKLHGIKTIVDLRLTGTGTAREQAICKKLELKYINFPTSFAAPEKSKVEAFLRTVSDPDNEPVYVHCRFGADRTGMMMAIYRVVVQKWSFDRAYTEMKAHQFKPIFIHMKEAVKRHEQPMESVPATSK